MNITTLSNFKARINDIEFNNLAAFNSNINLIKNNDGRIR